MSIGIDPAERAALRRQLIGLGGVVERNAYLIKRYGWWELAFFIWTVANTLTIVFIAKGVQATGGHLERRPGDDHAADRRGDLVLPRDHLRDPDRDRRLGAVGGHDRVHVHGAAGAGGAPRRHGPVRRALRRAANGAAVRGRGAVLRPALPRGRLRRRARAARRRLGVVRRASGW